MEFRTHEMNIPMIRAALQANREVWVHGDGNIFPVFVLDPDRPNLQDESKNHAENFNRGYEDSGYRVKVSLGNVPRNKAELDDRLFKSKMAEDATKKGRTDNRERVNSVRVDDSHYSESKEPAGDIDYSKYKR